MWVTSRTQVTPRSRVTPPRTHVTKAWVIPRPRVTRTWVTPNTHVTRTWVAPSTQVTPPRTHVTRMWVTPRTRVTLKDHRDQTLGDTEVMGDNDLDDKGDPGDSEARGAPPGPSRTLGSLGPLPIKDTWGPVVTLS